MILAQNTSSVFLNFQHTGLQAAIDSALTSLRRRIQNGA